MKEAIFKMVNAKKRLPKNNNQLFITLYKPQCRDGSWDLSWKDKANISWLTKEQNLFDVYWLEPETLDVEENIDLEISNKTKLTFDMENHELIKLHNSAVAKKV